MSRKTLRTVALCWLWMDSLWLQLVCQTSGSVVASLGSVPGLRQESRREALAEPSQQ